MSKQTGGPAFPSKSSVCGGSSLDSNGMTLRDYFAAKAMQSLIVTNFQNDVSHEEVRAFFDICAEYAYVAADAMLEARKNAD